MASSIQINHRTFWAGLVVYWLVTMGGAGAIVRAGEPNAATGWIVFVMLATVILCMGTDRGEWQVWKRIGFVPVAWILHAILAGAAMFLVGPLLVGAGRVALVDRAGNFLGSLPIVIWAMLRSRVFVQPDASPDQRAGTAG